MFRHVLLQTWKCVIWVEIYFFFLVQNDGTVIYWLHKLKCTAAVGNEPVVTLFNSGILHSVFKLWLKEKQ